MHDTNSLFLKCQCQSEAVEIEYDDIDKCYNISIWKLGLYRCSMTFKERIRWCWHILTTGKPWSDFIMLSPEQMKQLTDFYHINSVTIPIVADSIKQVDNKKIDID